MTAMMGKTKKTTLQKALEKKEREAAVAAHRKDLSLDSMEAGGDERTNHVRGVGYRVAYEVRDSRERYVKELAELAEKSKRELETARENCHPFYDGGWFARKGADVAKALAEYKGALERANLFKQLTGTEPSEEMW